MVLLYIAEYCIEQLLYVKFTSYVFGKAWPWICKVFVLC